MPELVATVVIPTLAADTAYLECVAALRNQTRRDIEIVVADNSGRGLAHPAVAEGAAVVDMGHNAGFGAAVNAGWRSSRAPFLATINDDAAPCPGWIAALVGAMESDPQVGMCASKVVLRGEGCLDSAGMLLCRDGSSKQRGHLEAADRYDSPGEALFPSASAALYRRAMLEQIGYFEEDFFLYCEDTDLGLRARWAGWKCLYVPGAVVDHRYSHSAGAASPLKAYYVERNRIAVAVRNLPLRVLALSPATTLARYFWHAVYLLAGRGAAARFHEGHGGPRLLWYVVKAHLSAARHFPRLWRQRRRIRSSARILPSEFLALMRRWPISAREVARL